MHPDLAFALELADETDTLIQARFRAADLHIETKPDSTPVTEADRNAEMLLRTRISEAHPDDEILGEEFGSEGHSGRRWVLDPIDATKNFMRGIPVWATLIALEIDRVPVLGVVSAPELGRRWWAYRDEGAFVNAVPMRVSGVAHLAEAQLAYGDVETFDETGQADRFLALSRSCARSRGFGDFWSHMLVAEGACDIGLDPIAAEWDLAALQVIVEEAGGRFTDFDGNPRPDGGSGISTNRLLHDVVLGAFGGAGGAQ
ncbi:MAG: histidinol-phosphatase, inositol monophosphatase family [Actinomycetia bacterium]|nr:histidinol-phosphatase, inositol monophosphatase family [Actinomycetes bacterium]